MEFNKVQDLLNRMKQAHHKGRGIRISAEELAELSATFLGELWDQPDPRDLTRHSNKPVN